MSGVEAAAASDRLPWLSDEPRAEPAKARRGNIVLWIGGLVAAVVGAGFWIGANSADEVQPPPTPRGSAPDCCAEAAIGCAAAVEPTDHRRSGRSHCPGRSIRLDLSGQAGLVVHGSHLSGDVALAGGGPHEQQFTGAGLLPVPGGNDLAGTFRNSVPADGEDRP